MMGFVGLPSVKALTRPWFTVVFLAGVAGVAGLADVAFFAGAFFAAAFTVGMVFFLVVWMAVARYGNFSQTAIEWPAQCKRKRKRKRRRALGAGLKS